MYAAYGAAHGARENPALIALSLFVAGFLAKFANISNAVADWANDRTAMITAGRLARFAVQLAFNLAAFAVMQASGVLIPEGVTAVGGIAGAAVLTMLASQGAQYFGIFLFQRQIGDLYQNVLIGISATIALAAFGTAGAHLAREAFLVAGIGFGAVIFGIGLLSDLRAVIHPRGGVGIFLGTFNPFHQAHLRLIRETIARRGLDKVIVHPTVVPWLHVRALQRDEIRIAGVEDGYIVYETGARADVNADYFPTGNRFLPPETRRHLIELAIEEAGLADKVEVAFMPEVYARSGFFGVVREIRRAHPGRPLHGIHGSDFGGMHARLIMDECGWIYPAPYLRRDAISASAIRAGAEGMTGPAVAAALRQIRDGSREITIAVGPERRQRRFVNDGGCLAQAH